MAASIRSRSPSGACSQNGRVERRVDPARADAVHARAGGAELVGERPRQVHEPALGRVVGRRAGRPAEPAERGHEDDRPAARLGQRGRRGLGEHEVGGEVDGEVRLERLDRELGERRGAQQAGHADDGVELPRRRCRGHQLADLVGVADVAGERRRAAAGGLHLGDGLLRAVEVDVADGDVRAVGRERAGGGPPDARRTSGDERGARHQSAPAQVSRRGSAAAKRVPCLRSTPAATAAPKRPSA